MYKQTKKYNTVKKNKFAFRKKTTETKKDDLKQEPKKKKVKAKKKKKSLKDRFLTVLISLIFIVGIGLISYPAVSNWFNQTHQSQAIAGHVNAVSHMDEISRNAVLEEAKIYNSNLMFNSARLKPTEVDTQYYNTLLNPTDDGIMGYLDIKKIDVHLAIYHGTSDAVLQTGVGHLEGSSLPVGGDTTHCLLSGHRGLPSATLFTHLDKLEIGDTFTLHVLGDVLTYQVDQIDVVLPQEVDLLSIESGYDRVTLITCTPYGVNSHRLLVRGSRIPTPEDEMVENPHMPNMIHIANVDAPVWILYVIIAVILILVLEFIRRKFKRKD